MAKKCVVRIEMAGEGDSGLLSVGWDKENMSYAEMLGYLEIAKDRIKEKTEKRE